MLKVSNTLTRKKEEFKPIKKGKVTFYQCGPTVYWTQHIGNMRAMVWADLIHRSLRYLGYEVEFVRNYTDVGHLTGDNLGDADTGEDRMDKGAKREGKTPQEIAQKYTAQFESDIKALNVLPPTHAPRATEYIDKMQSMIQTLIDKDFAYITPKAVYFDISRAKDYTRLSGQKLELNQAGAGTGDVQDSEKRNPADFALWFFKTGMHKDALQTWPAAWGEGFPGWHIECSAMIKALLGDTIDIHMGGVEHISIHHTNEIAQSESANGVPLAHYWLHNEHLLVDNKKMAKSEGTAYSVQEIIERGFDPLSLRYLFLQAHYRSKQNFIVKQQGSSEVLTWDGLAAAQTAYVRLRSVMEGLKGSASSTTSEESETKREQYLGEFREALEDDFNIPQALAVTWEVAKSNLSATDKQEMLEEFDRVLGLDLGKEREGIETTSVVQNLLQKRESLRREGKYEEADAVRKEIEEQGYIVKDTAEGQKVTAK